MLQASGLDVNELFDKLAVAQRMLEDANYSIQRDDLDGLLSDVRNMENSMQSLEISIAPLGIYRSLMDNRWFILIWVLPAFVFL